MARLNYPTRPELEQRVSVVPTGSAVSLDAVSSAGVADDGSLTVQMDSGEGTVLTLTYRTHPVPQWIVEPLMAGISHGDPGTLPEALIVRANRVMSTDGPRLERDWRSKTTRLIAGPRNVLPLLSGLAVTAAQTGAGWKASAVAGITDPTTLPGGPIAPTTSRTAAPLVAPSDPVGVPVPGHPALEVLTASSYSGDVILSREQRAKWAAARAIHKQRGKPIVVAMVGPSGQAKTHAVHALAAEEGLDVIRFDASGVTDPDGWFGTIVMDNGSTEMMPSDLLYAITMEGPRVLLIDEANRSALRAFNALIPILEGAKRVTIPQTGKSREIERQVQIVLTANIGSAFIASEPLDEAIRNRIGMWLHMDYLSIEENEALLMNRYAGVPLPRQMARKDIAGLFDQRDPAALTQYEAHNLASLGDLALTSSKTGNHPAVSSRQLLAAGILTAYGLDARLAVDAAILDGFEVEGGAESERSKVLPHVVGIQWDESKVGMLHGDECERADCGHRVAEHVGGTGRCVQCAQDETDRPTGVVRCMTYVRTVTA